MSVRAFGTELNVTRNAPVPVMQRIGGTSARAVAAGRKAIGMQKPPLPRRRPDLARALAPLAPKHSKPPVAQPKPAPQPTLPPLEVSDNDLLLFLDAHLHKCQELRFSDVSFIRRGGKKYLPIDMHRFNLASIGGKEGAKRLQVRLQTMLDRMKKPYNDRAVARFDIAGSTALFSIEMVRGDLTREGIGGFVSGLKKLRTELQLSQEIKDASLNPLQLTNGMRAFLNICESKLPTYTHAHDRYFVDDKRYMLARFGEIKCLTGDHASIEKMRREIVDLFRRVEGVAGIPETVVDVEVESLFGAPAISEFQVRIHKPYAQRETLAKLIGALPKIEAEIAATARRI